MTRSMARGAKALALAVALSAITASMAGAATTLTLTPTTADFGSVKVGNTSGPQSFKLSIDCNTIFCSASFNPTPSSGTGEYPLLNLCPATINVDHVIFGPQTPSCFIVASFSPAGAGARSGVLSTGTGGPTATLSGTGVIDAVVTQTKCKKGGKKSAAAAKKKCKKKKK